MVFLMGKFSSLEEEVMTKLDEISAGWKSALKIMEKKVVDQEVVIKKQETQIYQLNNKVEALEKVVENIYCKSNETNVIIKGVRGRNYNQAYTEINQIFNQLGGHEPRINNIQPLGAGKNKLMVKFSNTDDPNFLFKNAAHLGRRGYGLERDLPPKLREIRNLLLQQRREILGNGVATTVRVTSNSLQLDGKDWFDYNRATNLMDKRPHHQF